MAASPCNKCGKNTLQLVDKSSGLRTFKCQSRTCGHVLIFQKSGGAWTVVAGLASSGGGLIALLDFFDVGDIDDLLDILSS